MENASPLLCPQPSSSRQLLHQFLTCIRKLLRRKPAVPVATSGCPCGLLLGASHLWKCLLHVWAITGSVSLVTTVGSLRGFFSRKIFSTALLNVNHSAYNEAKDLVSSHHYLFRLLLLFLLLLWFRVEMEPRIPCILAQSYNLRL